MLIDAHQHFWRLTDRAGYWPPPELAAIYRDFSPADLVPSLRRSGIDGTVLVQSLPTVADTEYMLALAEENLFILGVVGWVDFESPDVPERIARLARNPLLKGLRPMLQDLPDNRWIERSTLDRAVKAMLDHRLRFDALVLPRHLEPLLTFAQKYPELPIVIDHAAKPAIAEGIGDPWFSDMRRLAALPHVHCKLSGLLTEAGDTRDAETLSPYVRALIELFGPERLLWGSDWPVLRLAGDYAGWLAMSRGFLAHLPADQQAAVFGHNAIRFYDLDTGRVAKERR